MEMQTQKYVRKPLYVDAVQVTDENFNQVAEWCQGSIETDQLGDVDSNKKYHIKVRVIYPKNPRQTKAFVGDWVLYTERGYKVYNNTAFHEAFDLVIQDKGSPSDGEGDSAEDEPEIAVELVRPPVEETVVPEGRRVLSVEEQETMAPEEVQELIRSGEAVLAQELTEGVASE